MAGAVKWDNNVLHEIFRSPTGDVGSDITRRGRAVQSAAQANAPVRTGELRRGIILEPTTIGPNGSPRTAVASTAPHTPMVEGGTGVFGRGMMIRPVSRRVLAWSEGGRNVFARAVRGRRATPFLAQSIDAATD